MDDTGADFCPASRLRSILSRSMNDGVYCSSWTNVLSVRKGAAANRCRLRSLNSRETLRRRLALVVVRGRSVQIET